MKATQHSNIKLYNLHFLVLFAGLVFGITVAFGVSLLPLTYGSDLEAARKLGIVSLTILDGYSKTRDIVNYMAMVALPIGFAILFWHLWARKYGYDRLRLIFDYPQSVMCKLSWLQLIAIFASILFISFNINYFFAPISGWDFLGEEGINLFAVSKILDGGVQSIDFTTGYGPMLIYPLAMLMKLLGATLLTDRIYTYLLNIIAYGIVTLFFLKTVRNRTVFALALFLYFSVFHPFVAVSPNTTYLRVAIGFLPLLFLGRYTESKSRHHLWIAGLIAGQSLLFSQEVAICTLIALATILFISNLAQKSLRSFPEEMLHLGGSCLLSIMPMLMYLAYKGALTPFLFELAYYPKLYAMGYSAIKFPSLVTLFTKPIAGQALFPYWLIFIYLLSAIWLIPQLLMGKLNSCTVIPSALLVMGLLLFRSALCRSDFYHFFFAAQPAFVLFFLILDRLVYSLKSDRTPAIRHRSIFVIFIFTVVYLAPYSSPIYRHFILWDFIKKGFDVTDKFTQHKGGHQLLVNRTGGVPIGEELVEDVARIYNFLIRNTAHGEYIYFYPNEAAYYFLFDRKNPTRYAFSYQAITSEQRAEIIRDLETKKPRFIVYSRKVWLLDDIQPTVQVPELHKYISLHYLPHEDMGEVLIMRRIDL
ncbi:MAG: hypothetical protein HXX17_14945 [Geobacteraceae bacterium]|nr:hypothetical protein [Geobacteraceae bacterium]